MNISLIRIKPVIRELRSIRDELSRLADCLEMQLAQQGVNVHLPKADTSGAPPSVDYTDEEADWVRETVERFKREDEARDREENESKGD